MFTASEGCAREGSEDVHSLRGLRAEGFEDVHSLRGPRAEGSEDVTTLKEHLDEHSEFFQISDKNHLSEWRQSLDTVA